MQGHNKVTFLRATIQKECNSQNSICQSEEINGLKLFGNTLHLSSSNAQLKFWSFLGCHIKILRKQILSFCHIFMVKTKIKCLTFDNSLRQTSSYLFLNDCVGLGSLVLEIVLLIKYDSCLYGTWKTIDHEFKTSF